MPGTSYHIERGFINALALNLRKPAIKALYRLSFGEMLRLAHEGSLSGTLHQDWLPKVSDEALQTMGRAVLLTKLTYLDTNLLSPEQARMCLEVVRFCANGEEPASLLNQWLASHRVFCDWLNRLLDTIKWSANSLF